MEKKKKNHFFSLLLLLLLLLFVPCILSRNFASENQEPTVQSAEIQVAYRAMRMMVEHFERIDIEVNDYPGSGANNRHDPKSPGTA